MEGSSKGKSKEDPNTSWHGRVGAKILTNSKTRLRAFTSDTLCSALAENAPTTSASSAQSTTLGTIEEATALKTLGALAPQGTGGQGYKT